MSTPSSSLNQPPFCLSYLSLFSHPHAVLSFHIFISCIRHSSAYCPVLPSITPAFILPSFPSSASSSLLLPAVHPVTSHPLSCLLLFILPYFYHNNHSKIKRDHFIFHLPMCLPLRLPLPLCLLSFPPLFFLLSISPFICLPLFLAPVSAATH